MRLSLGTLALGLLLGALGCGDRSDAARANVPLVKHVPIGLSVDGASAAEAWALFDRSTTSAFRPGGDVELSLELAGSPSISAIKIYGAPDVQIARIATADGTVLASDLDLSRLAEGWDTLVLERAVEASTVRVELVPNQSDAVILEIELWGEGTYPRASADVRIAQNDPGQIDHVVAAERDIVLSQSEPCAVFSMAALRHPTTYAAAYVVLETEDVFRPFVLGRLVNDSQRVGDAWLTPSLGTNRFVERIDPADLAAGANRVSYCLPADATTSVTLRQVELVGVLDRGWTFAHAAAIGGEFQAALTDGDLSTTSLVPRSESLSIELSRWLAPSAMALYGVASEPSIVTCTAPNGDTHELSATTSAIIGGVFVRLEGSDSVCARLDVAFDADSELAEVDVVGSGTHEAIDQPRLVVTTAREHFGDTAWVAGYSERPPVMTGPIRVAVDDVNEESVSGTFSALVSRSRNLDETWTVAVTATFPDGSGQLERVVLDHNARLEFEDAKTTPDDRPDPPERDPRWGLEGEGLSEPMWPSDEDRTIRLGTRVGLNIPAHAIDKQTTITLRHVGKDILPPMDAGLINVTAPIAHAYEFLPHGQRFRRPVEVVLPYAPALIPEGMTPSDVKTYFYDTVAEKWVPLERKAIDVGDEVTISLTDHFTIMINAVLAVPDNPTPLSFDPTTLSSIAAATPAAEIDLIAPPSPSSSGDANLSMPFRAPAARGAFSPSLGASYSSSRGNGWLGTGWDVPMSRIEIDTRWGVPTYASDEEVRYLLDGASLVPTVETEGPNCSVGGQGRRYRLRVEGAFSHILRCGNGPDTYHFEVRDRNGTLFVYGDHSSGGGGNQAASSSLGSYEHGGIVSWHLRRVEDTSGNVTRFFYRIDEESPTGGEPFRQIYPEAIEYTAHPSGPQAPYRIEFSLDAGTRPDVETTGRPGFKVATRHLLRSVRMKFQDETIREYVLTYRAGQFEKSLLTSIAQYGLGGCAAGDDAFVPPACSGAALFHEHRFDYFREDEKFAAPVAWRVDDDPAPEAAALGKGFTESSTLSGHITAKLTEGFAVGARASRTGGDRGELLGVYDVNGDGLPDQIFAGQPPLVLYNQSSPDLNPLTDALFSADGPSVVGIEALGHEKQRSYSGGLFAQGGNPDAISASVGGGFSNASTGADRALLDLDGDGFLDRVSADGQAKYSKPDGNSMVFEDRPFGAAASVDPSEDPLLSLYADEVRERLFPAAPVIQWTAPFSGRVTVTGMAQKPNAGGDDGVFVELFAQDTLVDIVALAPQDTDPITFPSPSLSVDVTRGDAIYLRVRTGDDDGVDPDGLLLDQVDAALTVIYEEDCDQFPCVAITDPLSQRDPTGRPIYVFDSRDDFSLAGTPMPIAAPTQGTVVVSGELQKRASAADLRACIQKFSPQFSPDPRSYDVPCADNSVFGPVEFASASDTTLPLSIPIAVELGDQLLLRVESELSFDPGDVVLVQAAPEVPVLSYSEVCLPNDEATAFECTTDPEVLAEVVLASAYFGAYAALADPLPDHPRTPLVVSESGTMSVTPPPLPAEPFLFAIRSDQQGVLFVQDCRSISCLTIDVDPVSVAAGESVTFELLTQSGFATASSVPVSIGATPFVAPLHGRALSPAPQPATPFAGGHRGWRYALWNERVPFTPTDVIADYDNLALLSNARVFEIGRSVTPPLPLFRGAPYTADQPAWAGTASVAFVSASSMSAALLGAAEVDSTGAPVAGLASLFRSRYVRMSGTRAFYLEASVGVILKEIVNLNLSLGLTFSDTATTTDMMDMNGDGIADVVGPTKTTLGDITDLLTGAGIVSALSAPDGFRKRNGFDYSIGFGGRAVFGEKTSGGRTLSTGNKKGPDRGTFGLGKGAGLAVGRSQTTEDLIDINGDGLPDRVRRTGTEIKVSLNLGNHFGAEEPFGQLDNTVRQDIDGFVDLERTLFFVEQQDALQHDTNLSKHNSSGFSLGGIIDVSKSNKASVSRTTVQIADINGDGLPDFLYKRDNLDRIRVQLNLGSAFESEVTNWHTGTWSLNGTPIGLPTLDDQRIIDLDITGPDVLAATGRQSGSDFSIGFDLGIFGGGYNRSKQTDSYDLALMDIDGDGVADHVLRRRKSGETGQVFVKKNQVTGRANLLQRIERPLGGSIELDYERVGNTVDLPQSRQVLSRVEVDDGIDLGPDFASPNLVTTYSYTGGFFSRSEKEFFGFETVTSTRADGVRMVDNYENQTFALRGALLRTQRVDPAGVARETNERAFDILAVFGEDGLPVPPDSDCIEALHPLLPETGCDSVHPVVVRETLTRSEDGIATKSRVLQDLSFDRFGNILLTTDAGDDAIASDDLHIAASYENDVSDWILGLPSSLEVRAIDASGEIMRRRLGAYDSRGNLTELSIDTGSELATTRFEYDSFGNLSRATTPPNETGEVQTIDVEYDGVARTYAVAVEDGFGYRSTTTIDLRFGLVLDDTDVNGQETQRAYDSFGRLLSVRGPYDGALPTLSLSYRHTESPPVAVTQNRSSPPPGYAGPVPGTVTTVVATDGLGRAIEQRATSVVGGTSGMTTSGVARFDAVGRVVATFHPFFTAGANDAFIPPQATLQTLAAYDPLDRVVQATFADGATVTSSFAIAPSPAGDLLFSTQTVDENGNAREVFSDIADGTRAFVEHPDPLSDSVTAYDYRGTGELSRITDAEGNETTLAYDRRGLLVELSNPDTGLIEQRYDLLGNRVQLIEPNHEEIGASVRFVYERDRLAAIDYPSKPDASFGYGEPGASFGRAGRLAEVLDETGRLETFYGALGETVRTVRVVDVAPEGPPGPPAASFDTRFVTDSLGRLLELSYPDGEIVTNGFDAAGNLTSVEGRGDGWQRTYVSDLRYDVFGNRVALTFGNGASTTRAFSPERVRLASVVTNLPGNATVQDERYQYDPGGNPIAIESGLPTPSPSGKVPGPASWTFTYDGVDRLTRAQGAAAITPQKTSSYDQRFAYSPSHNLLSKQRDHIVTQPSGIPTAPPHTNFSLAYAYAPSRPHAPTQVGDLRIAYDASGNPIERRKDGTGAVETLRWDDDGRLVEVQKQGTHQRNVYDATGVRVVRRGQQGETIFASQFYDLHNGTQGTKHVFAGSTRIASVQGTFESADGGNGNGNGNGNGGGGAGDDPPPLSPKPGIAYFFHSDHLGSTGVLSDEDGDVHQHLRYFPDGQVWIEHGPQSPINGYLFSGKPFDPETGFYDFGQRFYDPRTSLWLGTDAAFGGDPARSVGRPLLLAPYAYAGHNPIALTDPDGRDPLPTVERCGGICIGIAVVVGLTAGASAANAPKPGDLLIDRTPAWKVAAYTALAASAGIAASAAAATVPASAGAVAADVVGGAAAGAVFAPGSVAIEDVERGQASSASTYVRAFTRGAAEGAALGLAVGRLLPPRGSSSRTAAATTRGTTAAGGGATGAARATELLRPGGRLIGQAGSSSRIRILQGGQSEAEVLFNQLVRETGATPVTQRGLAGFAELPGGGTIGLRVTSRSGPPTIDVQIRGLGIREIKFVEP